MTLTVRGESGSVPDGAVDIGLQKQLLVDDHVIAETKGVTRELGAPKKCGIVLEPSLPTEFHPSWKKPDGSRVALDFGYYMTALWNDKDKKFQMWYMAYRDSGVGYAESRDGINWTKPPVGADGKSNIVLRGQGFSCMIDPTVPWGHPEKYKAASHLAGRPCCVALSYSPDGIHWKHYNNGNPVSHRAADTHNQILWDSISGQYRVMTRTDLGGGGGTSESRSARIMAHGKDNDLMRFPTAWMIIADRIAVDDPRKEKNRWGGPRLQFNGMTCWIYEDVYFGLMDVYTMDQSNFFGGFDYKMRHDDDYMDFYIGTSRDGKDFDKGWIHARRPLVPRGPDGSFDKDGIKPPSQIITRNDEHWIYYAGMAERHYSQGRHLNIGLAKLRLDGFVCLAAKDEPGIVVTKPFRLQGGSIEVNVDAAQGRIKVDVLDDSGAAINGLSGDNAIPGKQVDNLRWRPQWKGRADLSNLKGRVVRLRFSLIHAKLYSFQVR